MNDDPSESASGNDGWPWYAVLAALAATFGLPLLLLWFIGLGHVVRAVWKLVVVLALLILVPLGIRLDFDKLRSVDDEDG